MPDQINLFIFFGLIASGKSTLAAAWAQKLGADYYNSDRVRKELAGIDLDAPQRESFNAGIYSPEFSRCTYDRMLTLAEANLGLDKSVVLDGSYQAQDERSRVRELAQRTDKKLIFVLCHCADATTQQRLILRDRDARAVSDGRWEIYEKQKKRFTPPSELAIDELITFSTEATVRELVDRLSNQYNLGFSA